MSLVTVADVQALGADGGLSSSDLQTVIDREEAEFVRRYGANYPGSLTEIVHGGGQSIYLKRAITTITSVVEYLWLGDTAPVTLTATDYYVWAAEGRLQRVLTAGRWGHVVTVVYVPADDSTPRKQVLIELVRLAVEETNAATISGLSFSISSGKSATDWQAKREQLYGRLAFVGDR